MRLDLSAINASWLHSLWTFHWSHQWLRLALAIVLNNCFTVDLSHLIFTCVAISKYKSIPFQKALAKFSRLGSNQLIACKDNEQNTSSLDLNKPTQLYRRLVQLLTKHAAPRQRWHTTHVIMGRSDTSGARCPILSIDCRGLNGNLGKSIIDHRSQNQTIRSPNHYTSASKWNVRPAVSEWYWPVSPLGGCTS